MDKLVRGCALKPLTLNPLNSKLPKLPKPPGPKPKESLGASCSGPAGEVGEGTSVGTGISWL